MFDISLSAPAGMQVTAKLYAGEVQVGGSIAMQEVTGLGEYFASVPANTPRNKYVVVFFEGLKKLTSGLLFWDGEKEVNPLTLEVEVDLTEVLDAVGTPLQAGDYTAPDNQSIASIKAKVDTLQNTDVSGLPTLGQIEASTVLAKESTLAAIGTPLQAADYTAPPAAEEIAAQVELAILNDDDGKAVLQAIADKIGNENVSATVIAQTVRQEISPELAEISQLAVDLQEVKGVGFGANQHSLVKLKKHVTAMTNA